MLPHWANSEEARTKDTTPRYAGIDWASAEHAVCLIDDAGGAIERFTAAHRAGDLGAMRRRPPRAGVERVAIERPDGPVVDALMDAGLDVVVIPSRQVKALRERYGAAGHKDDAFDRSWCGVIRRCRHDRVPYDPAKHHALQRPLTAVEG